MAGNFKVGDLVWAKMKGFPSWPGKIIAPKPEVKRPANKKCLQFVFFFGSENYAWIPEDNMFIYEDNRNKFLLAQRIPRGYKEAIEAIEDALKNRPSEVNMKPSELPSIEEELAQIFPQRKDGPARDYSRDAGRKKKNGKGSTTGARRDSTNKDTPKSKKSATPKVQGKSDKSLSKSLKKGRKPKVENSSKESTNKSGAVGDSVMTNSIDSGHSDGHNNHQEEREDEESLPPTDHDDHTEQTSSRAESPEIFNSDTENDKGEETLAEGEENGGREEEKVVEEEPSVDHNTSLLPPTEEVVVAKEEIDTLDSNPSVESVSARPSQSKELSSRGENIFEMFQKKEGGGMLYEDAEEEEEEKGENGDDSMDYAVVTVDPDGQAHVLIENTIIDNEVVVLGQEEEVATEVVETENSQIIEDQLIPPPPPPALSDTEVVIAEEEGEGIAEEEVVGPEKEEVGVKVEEEQEENSIRTTEDIAISEKSEKCEVSVHSEACDMEEEGFEVQGKEGSDVEEEKGEMPQLEMEQQTDELGETEEELKDSKSDGEDKTDDTRTPTRRSTRTRVRKEEATKEKAKPKEMTKVESKPVVSRRGSGKRAGSPVNTQTKRGKMSSKAPASPGRSAAPTDQKPAGGLPMDIMEPAVAGPPKHDVIPTPFKIGFLGLGIMGHGMVNNLIKSGHEVTVWNRTAQKCREFTKEGALKGNTPAEVVASCDITFSCVSDPAAVKDLVFGNCGVLQGIQPGKGYVDMSTIDPDTVADVHEAVTSQGGRFLEAPVVGSRGPAQTGDLVILAAGDRTLYEDCYSCFESMGKKTFFLGETTSGSKMKLVVNMLMGTFVAGLAESLALADKVGLDQDALLQILDLSVMSCPLVRGKGQAIMMSRFEPQFPLQHQQKDLRLSINMADSVDQPLHVATATNELFKKAKAKGYSQHDMCAVYRAADM